jgi:hypothetical protein
MEFSDNFDNASNEFIRMMESTNPIFIGRFGGSDTNVMLKFYDNRQKNIVEDIEFINLMDICKKYNGFYDTENKKEHMVRFCRIFMECHQSMDLCTIAGHYIQKIQNKEIDFANELKINSYSYGFIESIMPFLNSFKKFAENKKIIIISPFEKSINLQKPKLQNLFKNYEFPVCSILTYNTPITYCHENRTEFPHTNWFETADIMCKDIGEIEFDIALLGCASYSMYLGKFIKEYLSKKAIYIGGVLQLFFGILGARYVNSEFYMNFYNNVNDCIIPIEKKEIFPKNYDGFKSEGYFAYF